MEKFKKFCQDHAPEIAVGTYVAAVVAVVGYTIYKVNGGEIVSVTTKDDVLRTVTEQITKSGKKVTYVTERSPELAEALMKGLTKKSS